MYTYSAYVSVSMYFCVLVISLYLVTLAYTETCIQKHTKTYTLKHKKHKKQTNKQTQKLMNFYSRELGPDWGCAGGYCGGPRLSF